MPNIFSRLFRSGNPLDNPAIPLSAGFSMLGLGVPTDSNEVVTELSSLGVPTVLACVRVLSEGVASLPLLVYEKSGRGGQPVFDHQLTALLSEQPNSESTAINLISTLMTHAVLWRNAYCEIERGTGGNPVALWPRVPWLTKPVRQNGQLVYETKDTANRSAKIIKADDMLHIVGFSVDGQLGLSLIQQARQSVGLALAAARFGARFYANDCRPGGVIELTQPLSPEDQARLRTDIEHMASGANAYRIVVLSPGMKYEVKAESPQTAQFVENRKFEREEIAAAFRVPGYMVGATEKTLKATIEAQNLEFLTYVLRPWIMRFEQEFTRKLLPSVGRSAGKFVVKFNVHELYRTDLKSQTDWFNAGRNGGWFSVNDIRIQAGLPPIDSGDDYLVPLNMVVAGQAPAQEPLETEDPEDVTLASTKSLVMPLFRDACSRIQHRAKRDSAAIRQAFMPIIDAFCACLRDVSPGTKEQEAVEKWLSGVESRNKFDAEDEFRRLSKALVYAVEHDKAEARAKEIMNDVN